MAHHTALATAGRDQARSSHDEGHHQLPAQRHRAGLHRGKRLRSLIFPLNSATTLASAWRLLSLPGGAQSFSTVLPHQLPTLPTAPISRSSSPRSGPLEPRVPAHSIPCMLTLDACHPQVPGPFSDCLPCRRSLVVPAYDAESSSAGENHSPLSGVRARNAFHRFNRAVLSIYSVHYFAAAPASRKHAPRLPALHLLPLGSGS